jgi:gamma-glutamylcyclotransferase (GGCT)/AIG2-like uncharacterized protein YtfP
MARGWCAARRQSGGRDVSGLIGVYGSLRAGGSNHRRLRPPGPTAVPCAVLRIPGRLYSLGRYCCAVPLADGEDGEVLVEIYEVDEDVFAALDTMERDAGYVGIDTTAIDAAGVERTFVVWGQREAPAGAVRVDGGDWVAFCRSRNQRH